MIRFSIAFLLAFTLLLLVGCGGGGGGGSTTDVVSGDTLKGVWTADLDSRAQRSIVAELTITDGVITGFLRLNDGDQVYSGPITGTYNPPHVQFTAQLEGHDAFTFESNVPLRVGQNLEGTFRFREDDNGHVAFHREDDRTAEVAGDWSGRWASSAEGGPSGTWQATLTQTGHKVQATGMVVSNGQESRVAMVGTIVGRRLDLGVAIAGERAALWKGVVQPANAGLKFEGRYIGSLVSAGRLDEGTVTGTRGGSGGGDDRLTIRPGELKLAPLATETLTASMADVVWTQRSDEAKPGEFLDATATSVRFHAPEIGGKILVRATASSNADLSGECKVLVTGASGIVGDDRFHSVLGAASRPQLDRSARWVVEVPTERGVFRFVTPFTEEPARFQLVPEVSGITLKGRTGVFVANGADGTSGTIAITRVGSGRLSGRFEATLKARDNQSDATLSVSGVFDVPSQPHR